MDGLKMNKKAKISLLTLLAIVTVFGLSIVIFDFPPSTSAIIESSTVSNATVAVTIGFTFSGNLSSGILYGSVSTDTLNNNATGNRIQNWSGVNGCTGSNCTAYWILMDTANNIGSDICVSDNAPLTITGTSTTIPNTGYTYDMNLTANGSNMNSNTGAVAITTSYLLAGSTNINASQNQTMQFYLDIPAGQTAGVYNNSVSFKIVETGVSC